MPLDRDKGEILSGLEGVPFQIAPLSKWRDTAMWEEAFTNAQDAFLRAGAILAPIFDDTEVLCQEYPTSDRLAFIFCKRVAIARWKRGEDQGQVYKQLYHPVVIRLSPGLRNELAMAGRWREMSLN